MTNETDKAARLYSVDVPIHATAYVRATSEAEALEIVRREIYGAYVEGSGGVFDGRPFSETFRDYHGATLSPAMTGGDPGPDARAEIAFDPAEAGDA